MQVLQDSDRKRRTLRGIRSCAELVENAESVFIGVFQDRDRVCHVGGERGQVLLDTLLVADVCVHFCEDAKLRAVESRYVKPRLPHQRKEPDRL